MKKVCVFLVALALLLSVAAVSLADVKPGDTVTVEIEGIGSITNPLV